jgi:hypothetical protein
MMNKDCCTAINYRNMLEVETGRGLPAKENNRRNSIKMLSNSGIRRYPDFNKGKEIF